MARVLIIDDSDLFGEMLSELIRGMGHEVRWTPDWGGGKELSDGAHDVVFLGLSQPKDEAPEVLGRLEGLTDPPEIILITGGGGGEGAELAMRYGAREAISRYSSLARLTLTLRQALEYREARKASGLVRALAPGGLVGDSPGMRRCYDFVAQAASCEAPVLLMGEPGTGKESVARVIHANSSRAGQAFVRVNCGGLGDSSSPAALWGSASISEPVAPQTGRQRLQGGTLFLAEAEKLSPGLQEALVQMVQGKGASMPGWPANFRVMIATTEDWGQADPPRTFLPQLLKPLRPLSLRLPPLRDRLEDLEILVLHHTRQLCKKNGLAFKGLAPEFLPCLRSHTWPGNIRELVQVLEHAVTVARRHPSLEVRHLPAELRQQAPAGAPDHPEEDAPLLPVAPPQPHRHIFPSLKAYRQEVLMKAEQEYLRQLFSLAENDFSEACRLSSLSQPRLYALVKKHRLAAFRKFIEKK